jgi:hypothetical protein
MVFRVRLSLQVCLDTWHAKHPKPDNFKFVKQKCKCCIAPKSPYENRQINR